MAYNQIILLNKRQIKEWLIMLLFSALFNLLFLRELSPIFSTFYSNDGSCFYIIAKAWVDGYIPYLDYFDHKGPIFYLFYVISYYILGVSKWGAFFIWNILFCWIIWMLKGISTTLNIRNHVFYLALTSFLLYYVAFGYDESYCTEIISLPFQVLSIWIFTRCIVYKKGWHNFIDSILYGIAFGVLLLIRPNNACINAAIIITCIILYLINSWYKELLHCALSFLLGLAVVILPTIIYYLSVGGLSDLYYCYIGFNMMYKSNWSIARIYALSNSIRLIPIFTICLYCLLQSKKTHQYYWISLSMFISAVLIGLVFIAGHNFPHYFVILSPVVFISTIISLRKEVSYAKALITAIIFCLLLYISIKIQFSIYRLILALFIIGLLSLILFRRRYYYIGTILLLMIPLYDFILSYPFSINESLSRNESRESACNEILNIIPASDYDSIYCDEAFNYEYFFQKINSRPVNKYFNLPSIVLLQVDPTLENNIEENFKSIEPKWILTSNEPTEVLKKHINTDYSLVDSITNHDLRLPLYIYNRNQISQ